MEHVNWKLVALILMGVGAGILLGHITNSTGLFVPFTNPDLVSDEFGCLTSVDLNREDIYTAMFFGRHCESLGLQSGVFWQEDEQGQRYAIPICMEAVG